MPFLYLCADYYARMRIIKKLDLYILKNYLLLFAGTFFICDCNGESFGSLSEEQLKKYTEMFKQPERFLRINGEILAVPYTPKKNQER